MLVQDIMTPQPICIRPDAELDEAIRQMDRWGIRHLPVVDEDRLLGIVHDLDLLAATGWLPGRMRAMRRPLETDKLKTAGDVMTSISWTLNPADSVARVAENYGARHPGCLPVVAADRLVGVVTEVDILRAFTSRCSNTPLCEEVDPPLRKLMSRDPVWIGRKHTLGEARETLARNEIRHLPVLENGVLVGLVSDRDVRRSLGCGRRPNFALDEVMTPHPLVATPNERASTAAGLIVQQRIGALPIVEDPCALPTLVGMVSNDDLLRHCAIVLQSTAECS